MYMALITVSHLQSKMDAGVVAEQLTMLNTELFLRVHPIEYVNYVFQVVGMGHSHAHSGTRNLDVWERRGSVAIPIFTNVTHIADRRPPIPRRTSLGRG